MTQIGKNEREVMLFFSENIDEWFSHREICEETGIEYNEGRLRKPLAKMVQAGILDKKQFKDGDNNQIQHWKAKDL